MILTGNSDYFLKLYYPADPGNGETWCFLCSTDGIPISYFDEFWLPWVKNTWVMEKVQQNNYTRCVTQLSETFTLSRLPSAYLNFFSHLLG
jgi:hypothetical protein